ncbi:putative protein TPRXL [Quercus lobata]|uniref:putative protein TPRXL n=1 Tax=Quercus lobata TaxID=97700 RepID=UPI001247984F|nr:putative protein TPRXL [Quercus lobata]
MELSDTVSSSSSSVNSPFSSSSSVFAPSSSSSSNSVPAPKMAETPNTANWPAPLEAKFIVTLIEETDTPRWHYMELSDTVSSSSSSVNSPFLSSSSVFAPSSSSSSNSVPAPKMAETPNTANWPAPLEKKFIVTLIEETGKGNVRNGIIKKDCGTDMEWDSNTNTIKVSDVAWLDALKIYMESDTPRWHYMELSDTVSSSSSSVNSPFSSSSSVFAPSSSSSSNSVPAPKMAETPNTANWPAPLEEKFIVTLIEETGKGNVRNGIIKKDCGQAVTDEFNNRAGKHYSVDQIK